jgi:sulfate adenylyltransferase
VAVPVCLDIAETQARSLETGQSVTLRDPEGFLLAVLHIDDMWPVDREKEADSGLRHPWIEHTRAFNISMKCRGDVYIGGRLEVMSLPLHFDFKQIRLSPAEIRAAFSKLGWNGWWGSRPAAPCSGPSSR